MYRERSKPVTVTRGLPHYVIGKDYQRLLRLAREYDHMHSWHDCGSRRLIAMQCSKLHYRVYRQLCIYA